MLGLEVKHRTFDLQAQHQCVQTGADASRRATCLWRDNLYLEKRTTTRYMQRSVEYLCSLMNVTCVRHFIPLPCHYRHSSRGVSYQNGLENQPVGSSGAGG